MLKDMRSRSRGDTCSPARERVAQVRAVGSTAERAAPGAGPLGLEDGSADLIVNLLGLHWANDLPGALSQIRRALRPDGLFVASLYVPAAFAGYLLGQLKLTLGWTQAGILQVTGCAILAALFSIAAGVRRPDPLPTTTTSTP